MEGFMRLRKFENELKVVLPRILDDSTTQKKNEKIEFWSFG